MYVVIETIFSSIDILEKSLNIFIVYRNIYTYIYLARDLMSPIQSRRIVSRQKK